MACVYSEANMNIVKFFNDIIKSINKQTAKQAKERLQIVVSHQRATDASPEFISKMRQELIAVISKYVDVDVNSINVHLQQEGNRSILELNIAIPDAVDTNKANSKKTNATKASVCA